MALCDDFVPGYFGCIGRRTAVALLRKSAGHGSFLLRSSQSMPGSFVLSFRVDPFVRHFTILKQQGAGGVSYTIGKLTFASISDLIAHYRQVPLSDNVCLGEPLRNDYCPRRLLDLSNNHNGVSTTHGSRIHCYDFPSALFENRGSSALQHNSSPAKERSEVELADCNSPLQIARNKVRAAAIEAQPRTVTASLRTCSDDVLSSTLLPPQDRSEFVSFVLEEHVEETILFLNACDKYCKCADTLPPNEDSSAQILHEIAMIVFMRFLTPASMYQVNINVATVKSIRTLLDALAGGLCSAGDFEQLAGIFDEAVAQARTTVSNDLYPRFVSAKSCRENVSCSEITAR